MTISYMFSPLFSGENLRYRDLGGVSVEGDVITFAKSVKTGITIITTHNTTTGLPNDTYQYSSGVILRRTDVIQVMLYSYDNNVAINTCRNNVWSGWDIITKNSDLLDTIKYKPYSTVFNKIAIQNDNGKYIIHFYNGDKWICKISAD